MNVDIISGGLPAGNINNYFAEAQFLERNICEDKERDTTASSESDAAKSGGSDQKMLYKLVVEDGKCNLVSDASSTKDDKFSKNFKKVKRNFTLSEDERIMEGINKFGKNWGIISESLDRRTPTQVRERYRRLKQKQDMANAGTTPSAEDDLSSDSSVIAESKRKDVDVKALANRTKRKHNDAVSCANAATPKRSKVFEHIDSWIKNGEVDVNHQGGESEEVETKIPPVTSNSNDENSKKTEYIENKNLLLDVKKFDCNLQVDEAGVAATPEEPEVQSELVERREDERACDVTIKYSGNCENRYKILERDLELLKCNLDEQQKENAELKDRYKTLVSESQRREVEYKNSVSAELVRLLKDYESNIRLEARKKLADNISRLGMRPNGSIPGFAYYSLDMDFKRLEADREEIDAGRKRLTKRKAQIEKLLEAEKLQSKDSEVVKETSFVDVKMSVDDWKTTGSAVQAMGNVRALNEELEQVCMMEQIYRSRSNNLKCTEADLLRSKEQLDMTMALHMKELRRIEEEDCSRWNDFPVFRTRYTLLTLLGRGGFSEVYRAYDLKDMRYVACKIHQLNASWSSDKKANYVRHATRECTIHHTLNHPRIVSLYDHFSVDKDTFCTVMQFCEGGDLDCRLKQQRVILENEAHVIMSQIVQGLQYLSQNKIIHYDLKPANILFDHEGSIKIADFGLSKMIGPDSDQIELTSQGAGTYWYLPPECFARENPQITSKVDVWSAGVILYQMLFACKPFGNEYSQKGVLENHLIHPDVEVTFPDKQPGKRVSDKVKSFLQKCLTASQAKRPDIHSLARDPWLTCYTKKCKSTPANNAVSNQASLPNGVIQTGFAAISSSGLLMSGGTIKLK